MLNPITGRRLPQRVIMQIEREARRRLAKSEGAEECIAAAEEKRKRKAAKRVALLCCKGESP